jgi:hypothetical protein
MWLANNTWVQPPFLQSISLKKNMGTSRSIIQRTPTSTIGSCMPRMYHQQMNCNAWNAAIARNVSTKGATSYCIAQCHKRYGFASNPSLLLWKNKQIATASNPITTGTITNHYGGGPTNRAFYQLHNGPLPDGTQILLGLGLKFCLETPTPEKDIRDSLERLR